MNTFEYEREVLYPTAWDAPLARFCNFMIITARSEDGKRLFRELMADDRTRVVKCDQQYPA